MMGKKAPESRQTIQIAGLSLAVRLKMESSNAVVAPASVKPRNVTESITVEIMRMKILLPVQDS